MRRPSRGESAAGLLAGILVVAACASSVNLGDPIAGLSGDEKDRFESGRRVFQRGFSPETGLGPLFNGTSCGGCHSEEATGGASAVTVVHATALLDNGFCDPLADKGGPVYQLAVTPALRAALNISREPIPPEATDTARRTTPDVFGFGLLDLIPDATLLALADPNDTNGDGISGRVNRFFDGRIGRFGRKALVPSLAEFNEGAFPVEQGITVPNVPDEGTVGGQPIPNGVDPLPEPELDGNAVDLTNAFVQFLAPPAARRLNARAREGQAVFSEIGCANCHVPSLRTGPHDVAALSNRLVSAYTDLLLHDMGPELADICLGLVAERAEFRTEPLMGLRFARRFLHDGRASSIEEAIELHGGEGAASRSSFQGLSDSRRRALLEFLNSLE